MNSAVVPPEGYPGWHTGAIERAEDAAYTFGYHLTVHCRDEALARLPADTSPETRAAVELSLIHI